MMLIKKGYWKDVIINDSKVGVDIAKCKEKEQPYYDYDTMHKIYIAV